MAATVNRGKLPTSESGVGLVPMFTRPVDANGDDAAGMAYQLAGVPGGAGETLAANTASTSVLAVQRADYLFDAQFAGSTSLQLQAQASDGSTWRTVATLTGSGTAASKVSLGLGARVRLYNNSGSAATGLFASLS